MGIVQVLIAPETDLDTDDTGLHLVDAVYARVNDGATDDPASSTATTIQETIRGTLDGTLHGSLQLQDVDSASPINLIFIAANGRVQLQRSVTAGQEDSISVKLTNHEVKAILAEVPLPPPAPATVARAAYFVAVDDVTVPFERSKLVISPIQAGHNWKQLGFDQLFHAPSPITVSAPWSGALTSQLAALNWMPIHLAVDGSAAFTLPQGSGDAWAWWLSGPLSAVGVVLDDLTKVQFAKIGIVLPPFPQPAPVADTPPRVPVDVTEAEVADNPDIYSEDPGSFCRPFSNPERVLGERSFFVTLRVEQPVISAEASVKQDPLGIVVVNPTATLAEMTRRTTLAEASNLAPLGQDELLDADGNATMIERVLPSKYLDRLRTINRGRSTLDAAHPVQWESDASRYQATTVARGHILEYRMRWRSNGYSLGTVAKTLTLAPRQTKRIQTIAWQRSELNQRAESTGLADRVSDSLSQQRNYDDAVQANLSEWAKGSSESTTAAGGGGFGFAAAGFVIGGGGGGSDATSTSSQSGGRRTAASEEQQLRDSIRRYGDSLRKLDSTVVVEVTQEESVTGTTQVIRNANYGHSLTVVYYQILRHLKIETAITGARECLFVPFAITPFTLARVFRWRELIRPALRDERFARPIGYLKDVLSNFANSDIPAGRRSDELVRYLYGSLFVKLAIDRPADKDDGSFDAATWMPISPFLGSPARSIFAQLLALAEAERDAWFQQHNAPTIAANWADTLQLFAGNNQIPADFTLASQYRFNNVARIDFSAAIPAGMSVTRETLSAIRVKASKALAPGSVANLQSLSFTYQTDNFERAVSASQGSNDLINVETGAVDPTGATVSVMPDAWERRDIRLEMVSAVQELIEHLNEHVEYYHKAIWWNMDRDRLFMLIDGFYAPGTDGVSIASVVERDPIAIIGNAIVFRVAAGSFLGIGNIKMPADLLDYYIGHQAPSEPMLISLPTDGLYAQSLMDECPALEEHFGNVDWVLNDPDPSLGDIAPELLTSRRAEPQGIEPAPLPPTLINLQNAPEAPAPSGLAGALSAVTTPNAFRDMAGLAGTQANAAAALQTAANLASGFGSQAAALKLAELASKAHDAQTADQKLATVQRAVDKKLVSPEAGEQHASQILESLHAPTAPAAPHQDPVISHAVAAAAGQPGSSIQASTPQGSVSVSVEKPVSTDTSISTDDQSTSPTPDDGSTDGSMESEPLVGSLWMDDHGSGTSTLAGPGGLPALDASGFTKVLLAFNSPEHYQLGDQGLQGLVDAYALDGLISGGAFIDEFDANGEPQWVKDWKIYTPDYSAPGSPYPFGVFPNLSRAHWQWIAPNAEVDADGNYWTPETLKNALLAGTAVTLSIGDIVMMSGDLVEHFDDFKQSGGSWRPGPVNVMQGYEQLEPFALTCLRLCQFPTPGILGPLADLALLQRNLNDYSNLQSEVRQKDPVWDRTKAAIEFLKVARGPSGCSELLITSRLLRHDTTDVGSVEMLAPWLHDTDAEQLHDVFSAPVLSGSDRDRLSWNTLTRKRGFNLDLLQIVLSNGYYGELALRNSAHFRPDNWTAFETAQAAALKMIDDLATTPGPRLDRAPIPADAVAMTAFGLHFLTDAFSAGHMRVPRATLGQRGALLAKAMHDTDGEIGLWVTNGFSDHWRAFGDGYLNRRSAFQSDLLEKLPASTSDTGTDANVRRITPSIVAAMKQLHYQAQKYFGVADAPFQDVLNQTRGDSNGLRDDEVTEGTPGPAGAGRDSWIAMDNAAKIAYLRNHQPIPLKSGDGWLSDTTLNVPELVLQDGSINDGGGYRWERHLHKLLKDRWIERADVGDIVDLTQVYYLATNFPSGATWYGPSEQGLQLLFKTLKKA